MIRVLHSCAVGSENVNGGCRMTAWREGSETGPKLNLSMSNQFCVRDAMEESDFMDSFPNVQIFFCFFAWKSTFPAKNADSVGQHESRSAPTYRVQKEAQLSIKQGSDATNTRCTARCCVPSEGGGGLRVPAAWLYYTADDAPGSPQALWRLQCPFIYIFT